MLSKLTTIVLFVSTVAAFPQIALKEENSKDICSLPPKKPLPFECTAFIPKWTYNAEKGVCEDYIYGGCGGTENLFDTKVECEGRCAGAKVQKRQAESCLLPKSEGECRLFTTRYYFEPATKTCQEFTYGGCKGNDNNFETVEDCIRTCKSHLHRPILNAEPVVAVPLPAKLDTAITDSAQAAVAIPLPSPLYTKPAPVQAAVAVPLPAKLDVAAVPLPAKLDVVAAPAQAAVAVPLPAKLDVVAAPAHAAVAVPLVAKLDTAPLPGQAAVAVPLPAEVDPVPVPAQTVVAVPLPAKLDFDPVPVQTAVAVPLPAPASIAVPLPAQLDSAAPLPAQAAVPVPIPAVVEPQTADSCLLPKSEGACRAFTKRYFFDPATRTCVEFTYGGCKGNENNFESVQECIRICKIHLHRPALPGTRVAAVPLPAKINVDASVPAAPVVAVPLPAAPVVAVPLPAEINAAVPVPAKIAVRPAPLPNNVVAVPLPAEVNAAVPAPAKIAVKPAPLPNNVVAVPLPAEVNAAVPVPAKIAVKPAPLPNNVAAVPLPAVLSRATY